MKATKGDIVHYVSPGSADGTFPPTHCAAIVTNVQRTEEPQIVDLCVFNTTGLHFRTSMVFNENAVSYTWHWPEREEAP